jgi:hypothetical protein
MRRAIVCFAAAAVLGGCFRTTIRSGLPPGKTAPGYDQRWHSGWFLGAIESSGPHRPDSLCPEGWAEVHTRGNFVTGLVTVMTSGIYAPHQVTVVCAAAPLGPPPPTGYPPLPRPTAVTTPPPPTRPPEPGVP